MLSLSHEVGILSQLIGRRGSDLKRRARTTGSTRPAVRAGRGYWAVGVAWSLAIVFLTGSARAEPQISSIIVAFDARSDAQKQAVAAIQAHVNGLPLTVVVTPVEHQESLDERLASSGALAASRHALGTFYIESLGDGSLQIFFTEAGGEATLIRRLRPNQQGLRVALEQAAIVVRSLVEALLEGGTVGIANEADHPGAEKAGGVVSVNAAQTTAAAPESTESKGSKEVASENAEAAPEIGPAGHHLALVVGSPLTQFAAGVPWQAGLAAGVHWRATPAIYLGARYTFFSALTLSTPDAAVSLKRHPLEVLIGYREAGRLALNAELGAIADRVARTTLSTAEAFQATSDDARWLLALGARGGFSWCVWPPACVSMRIGADFVLTPYAYTIDSGQALPSLRRVRPRVELDLAVWVW